MDTNESPPEPIHGSLDTVDALFLDVGGTLIYPRNGIAESYVRYAAEAGVELPTEEIRERFLPLYIREKKSVLAEYGMTFGRNGEEGRRFWRRIFDALLEPYPVAADAADTIFSAIYAGFEEAREWSVFEDAAILLAEAEKREIPMVVVSNWDTRLPAILANLGLSSRMEGVVCSAILGIEKPAPGIFEAAMSILPPDLRTGRVVHIGDSIREDIEGASAFGLETVFVDRHGMAEPGAGRVERLDQLVP